LKPEHFFLLVLFLFASAMQNRRIVLITNVKPGKLRDVMSEGLVHFLPFYEFINEALYVLHSIEQSKIHLNDQCRVLEELWYL
jgi:tRNA-binding EMAP/Myf-like protein